MAELAEAFVVLPGGLGTLDEMLETLIWAQLGLHTKPLALLNINGFFDPLLAFLSTAREQGLVLRPASELLTVATSPQDVVIRLVRITVEEEGV